MLSSTQHIRNSCSRQSRILLSSAKLQLRFASHSSKSDSILSSLVTKRKIADGINKVPTHILPLSSINNPNDFNQLKFLDQSSAFSRSDSSSNSLKILADSDNGNDDKSPPGSTPPDTKKDDTTKEKEETEQESNEKKTPEKAKKEKKKDIDESSKSKKPSSGKSKTTTSKKSPSKPPLSTVAENLKQQSPEALFTSASASDKKQILILPINRRPLIPGMF